MGYTKSAITNISWSAFLRATVRALTFVKLAILARILSPSDFGLIGIASLVLAFLEIVTETGINVFLLQEKKRLNEYLDTAFVVSIARGVAISLLIIILSKPISIFFNSPSSFVLILLIAIVPFVRGFINPSVIRFRKELQFRKEYYLQTTIFLVDTAVAVTIALVTKSAIGIVGGMIAGALVEVVLTQLFISPKPRFAYENTKLKKIISRGKWLTMAGFFNYLFENVDDMAVGKLLSDTSLGIYQVAYKISSLPITEVSIVVNRVTLPVYVRIKNDLKRLKRAYLKSLLVTFLIVVPIGLVLFFFPKQIITILLGEKWIGATKVVQVMSFFGLVRAITLSTYPVFLSLKKQEIITKITLVNIVFLIAGLLIFIKPLGIIGAGIAATVGAVAGVPFSIYFLAKVFSRKAKSD